MDHQSPCKQSRSPSAPALYPSPAPTMDDLQMHEMSGPGVMPGQLVTSDMRMQVTLRNPFEHPYGGVDTTSLQHLTGPNALLQEAPTPPALGSDELSSGSSYTSHFEDSDRPPYDDLEFVRASHSFSQGSGLPMPADGWPSCATSSLYHGSPLMGDGLTGGNLDPGMIVKREDEDRFDDADHECMSGDYDDGYSESTVVKGKTRRRSTPADKARVTCNICGTPFARTFNYNTHMATHNPHRRRPFKCDHPQCDKSFFRQTDLNRHEQSVHVKSKAFQCDWCGKGFPRKDSLTRHREDGCSRRLKTKSHRHSQSRSSAVSTSPNARYSNAGHMFPQSELQQYTPADQALRLAHQPATSNMRAAAVASSFAGSVAHSYGGSPWQGSQ